MAAAAPRRPDDRRGGEENRERDRDLDEFRRKEVARAEPQRRPQQLNEYFIDGEGILREVLQMEICKYLGAEATCRPGDYNGRPGFRVKALRPFTPQMIDDLKTASREYVSENQIRRDRRYQEVPYEESDTRRRKDDAMSSAELSYQSSPSGYPSAPGYEAAPNINYPPSTFPSGTGYVSTTTFATAPGLGAPAGYPGMTNDPNRSTFGTGEYTYEPNRGGYAQPGNYSGYAPQSGYRGDAGPREQLPPGYGYASTGPPMQQGRPIPMDPSHGYYDPTMGMPPPNPNPYQPPYHGGQQQYSNPNPGRGQGIRPPQPQDYSDYGRRR